MASTQGHTVKAFDDDLGELRALVAEMGGLAETAIEDAMEALQKRRHDAPVPFLFAPNGRKMPGNSMRIDVFIAFTAWSPDTVQARATPRVARSTRAAPIAHAPSAPCS